MMLCLVNDFLNYSRQTGFGNSLFEIKYIETNKSLAQIEMKSGSSYLWASLINRKKETAMVKEVLLGHT